MTVRNVLTSLQYRLGVAAGLNTDANSNATIEHGKSLTAHPNF